MSDQNDQTDNSLPTEPSRTVMSDDDFRSIKKFAGPPPPDGWAPTKTIEADDPRHGTDDSPARNFKE